MPASTDTVVLSSRYHRAARDGLQAVVAEASSRESNARDQEGLTPTLWAAFCGHVDVLRVLVSRGGVPGKCDRLGNTGLHLAASGGHVKCVAFLVALGEDVWALNIDSRTPRDLAAASPDGETSLRLLDAAMAREMALDPKKCRTKKEKARQRADKITSEYRKYHEKTKREEEEERRSIMERSNSLVSGSDTDSVAAARRHSEASVASSNVTSATSGSLWSAVRLQTQRGRRASNNSKASSAATSASTATSAGTQRRPRTFHFKVGTVSSDGSRTARKLPGLAPNTEVLFVNGAVGTRRNSAISNGSSLPLDSVTDAFELAQQTGLGQDTLVVLPPELGSSDSEYESEDEVSYNSRHRTSIFDRPGFGNMAFRHSLTGLEDAPISLMSADNKPMESNWIFKKPSDESDGASSKSVTDSVTSLEENRFNYVEEDEEQSPLHAFLEAWGLSQLSPQLSKLFRGDLDSLMLVTEDDLTIAGIPMGPRKKLLRAIELRNEALDSPPVEDLETRL